MTMFLSPTQVGACHWRRREVRGGDEGKIRMHAQGSFINKVTPNTYRWSGYETRHSRGQKNKGHAWFIYKRPLK